MKLLLMRHGIATDLPQEGNVRPLTDEGKHGIELLAKHLGANHVHVERVYHSGKLRATQTAEIVSRVISANAPEMLEGLMPNDSVDKMVSTAQAWSEDTLLVGHLPFMGVLLTHLILDNAMSRANAARNGGVPLDPDIPAVGIFHPGTVVCLQRVEGRWRIEWMMSPQQCLDVDGLKMHVGG